MVKMNVPWAFPFYFIRGKAYLILNMATHCHTTESVAHSKKSHTQGSKYTIQNVDDIVQKHIALLFVSSILEKCFE